MSIRYLLPGVYQDEGGWINRTIKVSEIAAKGCQRWIMPQAPAILLFVPATDLAFAQAEVTDIINARLDLTIVQGALTQVDVTRAVRETDAKIVWFVSHLFQTGIYLGNRHVYARPEQLPPPSSPDILDGSALAALVRGRFRSVILNTCASEPIARMLQHETGAEIICTVADIPDIDAYRTGSLFADWLAKTGSVAQAYRMARPGGAGQYVHLAGDPAFLAGNGQ